MKKPTETKYTQSTRACRPPKCKPTNPSAPLEGATPLAPRPCLDVKAPHSAKAAPKQSDRQTLLEARMGRGPFRDMLIRMWRRCPITGCRNDLLLRVSHIKPWCFCTRKERLDPFNGLLFAPNADAAFNQGLISFTPEGRLLVSRELSAPDRRALGLRTSMRIPIHARHEPYMQYHRECIFLAADNV
jgi:hypothetical protein